MVSHSFQGKKRLWTIKDEEEDGAIPQKSKVGDGLNFSIANSEASKWPVSQIQLLLRFYAAHRCLWDVECKDYRNHLMRQVALVDITAAMGTEYGKDEIVQKINILRATYRYERKRIKQRMKRGHAAKTKLNWFALADAFLRNVPQERECKEDSDLEESHPKTKMPWKHSLDNRETISSESIKPELFSDETQSAQEAKKDVESSDSDSVALAALMKPKIEVLESTMEEQLKAYNDSIKLGNVEGLEQQNMGDEKSVKQENSSNSNNDTKPLTWTLETTFEFMEQLKQHPLLWQKPEINEQEDFQIQALNTIALNMNRTFQSIAKRWTILQQTYKQEKQKILENPIYEPPFKWWQEAERLFENQKHIKTEFINLEDNELEKPLSDNELDYEERFQNPIPSVAPMSQMNEAMASLFHDDFSLESNTNSSFPLETENSSHISKILQWQPLEDDLLEGKWSLKHSVKFLRLYGVHRCLWDLNDPNYRCRVLRNAAIEDIAASMGHGLTSAYVAKKIKIFRITYMQQRKRILEATKRGETPDIMLKWFPLADSFLRPHIGLRSIKADAQELPQFDFQYVYANLNLIDPGLLTDFRGKGTQNAIAIGNVHGEESNNYSEGE